MGLSLFLLETTDFGHSVFQGLRKSCLCPVILYNCLKFVTIILRVFIHLWEFLRIYGKPFAKMYRPHRRCTRINIDGNPVKVEKRV